MTNIKRIMYIWLRKIFKWFPKRNDKVTIDKIPLEWIPFQISLGFILPKCEFDELPPINILVFYTMMKYPEQIFLSDVQFFVNNKLYES